MLDSIPSIVVGPVSFFMLLFASWCVGEGGEILGQKYDASVIGGLIIAWLNTAPEAIFFVTALVSSNPRFAVGAVSGSTIVVCTVALGACLYIGARARKNSAIFLQPQVKRQCMLLGLSLSVTISLAIIGFSTIIGIVGVVYYIFFIVYSLGNKLPEESKEKDVESGVEEEEHEEDVPVYKGVMYLAVGGTFIFAFSKPFIVCVVEAASSLHVNPILLAFFLAPIASEMPEILESVSLARKGNSQNINIAMSNLVGGTMSKTTLLCGIFCFFGVSQEFEWESPSYTISLALLIVCAGAAAAIGYLFKQQTQYHGLFLFALFIVVGLVQYLSNASPDSNLEIEKTLT
eukprot:Phypoly_transcript_10962.p1 GENE.Phypoly_transcript_10962~~Phypoly_transcript_10962.p1  ORF type:complete len:346 (+),score=47.27 Phypoly_transcript_10962:200-1237(+)